MAVCHIATAMKVYAESSKIVFECEHCGVIERLDKIMKKRTFQGKLNKFYRQHGWKCEMELERQSRQKKAVAISDEIIKQYQLATSCR